MAARTAGSATRRSGRHRARICRYGSAEPAICALEPHERGALALDRFKSMPANP